MAALDSSLARRPWARLLGFSLAAVIVLAGCGKGGPGAGTPQTELLGKVTQRAEGFDSRPGWAEPGQAWSKSGDTLVVVGYAKVRGDQRMEMAFRVSDSYARAELLRFLTVRVVAVLADEEASGEGGLSEADRRVLEERVTSQSEALIDQWFVSARYWERRTEGSAESLHVFSRLEVDRAKLEELLQKSGDDMPDLRLGQQELAARLTSRWGRIAEVAELNESGSAKLTGVSAPEWAAAGDSESEGGFTFVCQARAEDEGKAEALARARCNEKLCQLFGVQIIARTTVKENLEELTAESEVTEQCADVRAVGRKTTNRSSECTDEGCVHWLKQTYPRAAYVAELERQKEPTIIRQEVVVQEGDVRYRDPTACDQSLRQYSAVEGLSSRAYEKRLGHLNAALKSCQGIDGRDSGLFASLNLLLTQSLWSFVFERGLGTDIRAAFAAVPVDFRERLLTERFLTTRIQMVRDVVRDAVFPLALIDAVADVNAAEDDQKFDELVRRVVELPLDDQPISKFHVHGPHAIMLGVYYGHKRFSARYRAFLLKELARPTINCDRPDRFDAEQVAAYLRSSDKAIDDQEYSALLTAFRRAPSVQMDRCLGHLVEPKRDADSVRIRRIRELARLVIEGKLVLTERTGKDPPPAADNVRLFERVLYDATPQERLDLFMEYHTRLTGGSERRADFAKKITLESFGGLAPGRYNERSRRPEGEILSDCQQLAERFRAAHAQAPELLIGETDVCECLRFPALDSAARDGLVELWSSMSDRVCKHFQDAEWPGGHVVWPYEKRRWSSDAGTPFRRIPQVLRSEYSKCGDETGISGVRFTPTLHATLEGRTLRKVSLTSQISGTLRNMSKRGDYGAIVRVADVEQAQQKFEACFRAAAEGYEVDADQLEKVPSKARRVWLEFGDQGVSHGYE